MSKTKPNMFLRVGILAFAIMMATSGATNAVMALDEHEYNLYWQNSIFFYNPYECEPGTTKPSKKKNKETPYSGEEVWDGSCSSMTATRIAWLRKYANALQKVASKNGIPWELIAAQTFQESGGGKHEACDHNPLGLKAKKGHAKCSNGFAKFDSYEEAFQYYMDSIIPIKNLKNKYPDDPYSAVSYIQYGASSPYASCDSEKYSQCVGHMGEPTPGYVQGVSSLICGIQKWAQEEGYAISYVTWEVYLESIGKNTEEEDVEEVEIAAEEEPEEEEARAEYCPQDGKKDEDSEDEEYDEEETKDLLKLLKEWVWPSYRKNFTERRPAYAEYIDTKAVYKGDCSGVDCGAFVANIMRASGWEPNYPQGPTSTQNAWLRKNWKKVSPDNLVLGDVGIKPGHVILYVGNVEGINSKTASASQCDRAPMAGSSGENLNKYTWYRKK